MFQVAGYSLNPEHVCGKYIASYLYACVYGIRGTIGDIVIYL